MARLCLALSGLALARAAGEGPVIGIYPSLPAHYKALKAESYYKVYQEWVEQHGASTLILPAEGDADWYFPRINALLLPGGPTRPPPAFAHALLQRAMQANAEGDYFAVWGTCLGFEWLVESTGGQEALEIGKFDATDMPMTLSFRPEVGKGRMFQSANSSLMNWIERDNITYENHEDGIEPERFESNSKLAAMFDIVATTSDRKGRAYVAAVQAKHMPIYGVQFHPEKIRYLNNTLINNTETPGQPGQFSHIPKTEKARSAADLLGHFVVSEARRNGHLRDNHGELPEHIMV